MTIGVSSSGMVTGGTKLPCEACAAGAEVSSTPWNDGAGTEADTWFSVLYLPRALSLRL